MKKFLTYLLIALPLVFMATACDDDDDKVPNVGVRCTISGGVFIDDVIYVEQGNVLKIDGLTLINNTDQEGTFGAVSYYWDHYLIGTNPAAPYELLIDTSDLPLGNHLLQAQMPVYVVGYPICWGYFQYEVCIVEPQQLPEGDAHAKIITGIIKAQE